jgi:uncharacterized membrane protein YeiH
MNQESLFLLFDLAGTFAFAMSAAFLTTLLLRTAAIFPGWSLPKLR